MALQDIVTNLGTAIINLVDRKILKHCEQIETVLLELKAKIDILVEESGENNPDIPVTPATEEFDINGYTGTITTLLEDDNYVTIYEFNPVLNITDKWFRGTYDNKPNKVFVIRENDEVFELSYGPQSYINPFYNDTLFQAKGSIKQVKLYSTTIQKINISSFSTAVMPPR